jgi:hypothetical protein
LSKKNARAIRPKLDCWKVLAWNSLAQTL